MDRIPASSARRALKILGDAWVLRILRDAFRGTRRFNEWQQAIGLPRAVLSNRLKRLADAGIFRKWAPADAPTRPEYWLTEEGQDLWSVLLAMWAWEVKWDPDPRDQRLRMVHLDCGQEALPVSSCGACGKTLSPFDTEAKPGPGAKNERKSPERSLRRSGIATQRGGEISFRSQNAKIHGNQWNSALVAAAFKGARRFGNFEEQLRISPNILSRRLAEFVAMKVFDRHAYQANPPRYEYRLTEKGRDLFPVTLELIRWGDRWLTKSAGPPVLVMHKPCGGQVSHQFRCSHCGQVLERREVHLSYSRSVEPLAVKTNMTRSRAKAAR